jgi:hypothetical protein
MKPRNMKIEYRSIKTDKASKEKQESNVGENGTGREEDRKTGRQADRHPENRQRWNVGTGQCTEDETDEIERQKV